MGPSCEFAIQVCSMSRVVCSFRMHPRPHAHMMLIQIRITNTQYATFPQPLPRVLLSEYGIRYSELYPNCLYSSCSHHVSTSLPVQIRNTEYGLQKDITAGCRKYGSRPNSAWNYGAQNTKRKHVSPRLLHRADGPSISYWLHFLSLAFISK